MVTADLEVVVAPEGEMTSSVGMGWVFCLKTMNGLTLNVLWYMKVIAATEKIPVLWVVYDSIGVLPGIEKTYRQNQLPDF